MRRFTTLFLLALAMTIGANQAFAQQAGGANNTGRIDRPDRDDRPDDDGGDDPTTARGRLTVVVPCLAVRPCLPPPRRVKPAVVKKEPEGCHCELKVMRVGARFVTVADCYQSVQINGRALLRYCREDG